MSSLEECERLLQEQTKALREKFDAPNETGHQRLPFSIEVAHEGLQWRLNDLARGAIAALREHQWLTALLLTRAAFETTAALHYLGMKVGEALSSRNLDALEHDVERVLLGRKEKPEPVESVNVLTTIKHLSNETAPAVNDTFLELCEFCHPNWLGAMGTYGRSHVDAKQTLFGPWREDDGYGPDLAEAALEFALGLGSAERGFLEAQLNSLRRLLPLWAEQQGRGSTAGGTTGQT